jgi:C4-dicarboxylate-binding protein DctP
MYTQRMHETQKYLTVSNHGYLGYAVIVNKKFWDGLPGDVRSQLEGAMKDATKYTNAIAEQENRQAMDAIKKQGKTEVYRGAEYEVRLLPKVRVEIAVADAVVEKIVDAITQAANSNKIGDGKIFVLDLESVLRIRTGEKDEAALSS